MKSVQQMQQTQSFFCLKDIAPENALAPLAGTIFLKKCKELKNFNKNKI
jgi:hypothetical protein